VRNTKHLQSLLKLLAYQIGGLVNFSDIANRIGISRQTVQKYVDVLKKIFIIYTLPPFRKNRRDEIGKTEKIYFYDLGIRNALINDFSPVEYRRDYGALFENFVVNELQKIHSYNNTRVSFYYWRTKGGAEVDLILDKEGAHSAKYWGLVVRLITMRFRVIGTTRWKSAVYLKST
jgi:predicted AAA+ superfamily ATPase